MGVYILRRLRIAGYYNRNFIIVGQGKKTHSIKNYYQNHPELGMKLIGKYDENVVFDKSLMSQLSFAGIEVIYVMMSYIPNNKLQNLIETLHANNFKVKVLMEFNSFLAKGISIDYHDYIPVFNISANPPLQFEIAIVKRLFDLGFSVIVMLVGFPFFFLLGIVTKLTSKGPMFYKSERIGLGGMKFQIYKFRSMVVDADEIAFALLGGDFHSQGSQDPRITKWGQLMRKTRLDELPQFWNVIKGEMSIVGPRPLPKYDVDMILEASEDKYHGLLMMKPGLTSLGQIRVGYATNQEENVRRMNMDLLYHRKYSLWNDIWLVFQTAKLMLDGKGK